MFYINVFREMKRSIVVLYRMIVYTNFRRYYSGDNKAYHCVGTVGSRYISTFEEGPRKHIATLRLLSWLVGVVLILNYSFMVNK